jgi:hypothetical protein
MRLILLLVLVAFISSCDTNRRAYSSGWHYSERSNGGYNRYDDLDQAAVRDKTTEEREMGMLGINSDFSEILPGHPKAIDDSKPDIEKKIIYNADLSLNVKKPDSTNKELVKIAERYEGYAQSIATDYTVIRVKADKLEMALRDIDELGKIDYRNVKADDVTDSYYDFQIRLDNAERARSRYLELLAKAATVEETLKVEKELERLNGEIDLLKGKLSRISHLTEYATISIRLHEKVKPGVLGYVFIGAWKAVKWLFVRN